MKRILNKIWASILLVLMLFSVAFNILDYEYKVYATEEDIEYISQGTINLHNTKTDKGSTSEVTLRIEYPLGRTIEPRNISILPKDSNMKDEITFELLDLKTTKIIDEKNNWIGNEEIRTYKVNISEKVKSGEYEIHGIYYIYFKDNTRYEESKCRFGVTVAEKTDILEGGLVLTSGNGGLSKDKINEWVKDYTLVTASPMSSGWDSFKGEDGETYYCVKHGQNTYAKTNGFTKYSEGYEKEITNYQKLGLVSLSENNADDDKIRRFIWTQGSPLHIGNVVSNNSIIKEVEGYIVDEDNLIFKKGYTTYRIKNFKFYWHEGECYYYDNGTMDAPSSAMDIQPLGRFE